MKAKKCIKDSKLNSENLFCLEWFHCDKLPPRSEENKLRSIKVVNQDGDSVYYSYGYKAWLWWLSVNIYDEPGRPEVTRWARLDEGNGNKCRQQDLLVEKIKREFAIKIVSALRNASFKQCMTLNIAIEEVTKALDV